MELERIRALAELMQELDLRELEIQEEQASIRLSRGMPAVAPGYFPPPPAPGGAATPEVAPHSDLHPIVSPMVGTFYKAPSPDADPYVSLNGKVAPDKVVCIIEAMKVMNEIRAEVTGEVVEILVENGEAVEYGQPLFLIKTK